MAGLGGALQLPTLVPTGAALPDLAGTHFGRGKLDPILLRALCYHFARLQMCIPMFTSPSTTCHDAGERAGSIVDNGWRVKSIKRRGQWSFRIANFGSLNMPSLPRERRRSLSLLPLTGSPVLSFVRYGMQHTRTGHAVDQDEGSFFIHRVRSITIVTFLESIFDSESQLHL